MISDWSGVAFEYAFSRESPVIFIEVPRKVNNPEYKKLGLEAFEVYIRSKIGVVVSPDRLKEIPKYIEQFCSNPQRYQEQIRKVRSDQIFNIGKSGAVGAEYIMQIAKNCQTQMKRSS